MAGLEPADQCKDIALAVRERIEPPSSLVSDDYDFGAPPIFDGAARALLQIDCKTGLLQSDGAAL